MNKNILTTIVNIFTMFSIILCSNLVASAQESGTPAMRFPPFNAIPVDQKSEDYLKYGNGGLNSIPYEKITGSPFWSDEWKLAVLYGSNSNDTWICKTRLNLATEEVYFLDKQGEEKALDNGTVKKIVFYNADDTVARTAVFILGDESLLINEQKINPYIQVLNNGDYELLKLSTRILSTGDSLLGTLKRYYFSSETKYFVSGNSKKEPVKKLKKENILLYLPNSSQYDGWMDKNKIDFRKEDDIVAFFNYYNSQKSSAQ